MTVQRLLLALAATLALASALMAVLGFLHTTPWAGGWLSLCLVWLPALACCVFGASSFASTSTRANILLATASAVVALYMAEALLRLRPAPIPGDVWQELEQRKVAESAGYAFDERDPHRLLLDLRAEGVDAWPTTPAEQLLGEPFLGKRIDLSVNGERLMPLSGISSVRVDRCRESGRYPQQRSDGHGFVNPPGLWSLPVEVMLIGDSFVHGMCTEADESIASLVREQVPHTLSVGIGGWGPLFMLGALEEYATVVRPEHVFWLYYEGNDLLNLQVEREAPVLPRYLTPGFTQNLFSIQGSIDSGLKAFVEEALAAYEERGPPPRAEPPAYREAPLQRILSFVKLYQLRSLLALTDLAEQRAVYEQVSHLEDIVARAKATAESWGGTFHFVYLPRYARYSGYLALLELPQLRARARVLEMAEGLGLRTIDIDSAFRATPDPRELFFYAESHYNARGNRVVAEALLGSLGMADSSTSEAF